MASWFDYVSLLLTLSVIAALGYAFFHMRNAWSGAVASTKGSLREKGVNLSKHGVSVKTDKRFNREEYLDATQRGFIKALNASSAGNQAKAAPMERKSSGSSSSSGKRGVFGRRAQTTDK